MYFSLKFLFGSALLIGSIGSLIFINIVTDPLFLIETEDIILDNDLYTEAPRDGVYIEEIFIHNNHLVVEFSYGGGCAEHFFSLIGSNEYMESYPVRTSILLSHQSNNDTCTALFTAKLGFSLMPLKNEFHTMYPEYAGPLKLSIAGGQEVFILDYDI